MLMTVRQIFVKNAILLMFFKTRQVRNIQNLCAAFQWPGQVIAIVTSQAQMANSIPRISDDGSVVVVSDGPVLRGYVNNVLVS